MSADPRLKISAYTLFPKDMLYSIKMLTDSLALIVSLKHTSKVLKIQISLTA